MNNKKKCFVIMPFSTTKSCTENKWTEIFEYIIKPAIEESGLGYECERSVAGRENIVKGILDALNKANVVIADLTDNNPNVFYELGVRHTLTNRTILIAQGEEHIPFDLKPYPVAFYSESPAKIVEFKKDIKKKLEDIEKNPERSDNPVGDFLKERNIFLLRYEKNANLKKLDALLSELSFDIAGSDKIVEQLGESDTSLLKLQNTCLKLLLSTRYISPTAKVLDNISLCERIVDLVNRLPDLLANKKTRESATTFVEILPTRFKGNFISLLKSVAKIRTDFANDNYQEPKEPIIRLASPEHEKYLKLTE